MTPKVLRIETPRAFLPLLRPSRYKGAYGGRGGAKSHFFAESLIERCVMQPTRWACIREVQNSIKESVRQLLVDKIAKFGLEAQFECLETEIRGPQNSLIIFKGMQHYNSESIKSLEGFDGAWVEEAQSLSATSLKMLRPTIRKPGSELWFSWNPRNDTDPVDLMLRGANPPPDTVCIPVSWKDNPWFPAVLREEMEYDYADDPDNAEHVWGGAYEIITEGAYYARLIAVAETEGRIGSFPYDPSRPVHTAWDIGVDDYTAIWFLQENGKSAVAIDYFEASGEGAEQIVRQCMPEMIPDDKQKADALAELGRVVPYKYGTHYLPHDVRVREWGHGAKTRMETLNGLGVRPIRAGVAADPQDRINATRKLLSVTSFDKIKCAVGISRLRKYRRRLNQSMNVYTGPLHDENSHGSDSFGEFAVNCQIIPAKPAQPSTEPSDRARWRRNATDGSWQED